MPTSTQLACLSTKRATFGIAGREPFSGSPHADPQARPTIVCGSGSAACANFRHEIGWVSSNMTRDAQKEALGRSPLGHLATIAIGLEILLGIGAIGGGLALMAGPNGEVLPLPVAALSGSPFANYFVPGAILFAVIGMSAGRRGFRLAAAPARSPAGVRGGRGVAHLARRGDRAHRLL